MKLDGDRISGILGAVKGLTLSNVMVIALLAVIALPTYVVYQALNDDKLLDRLLSTYEEFGDAQVGCVLRHVQERGGPDQWGISSGFAFQGADRWFVSVVMNHEPSADEMASFCESLKLISDKILAGGSAAYDIPVDGQR